MSSYKISKHRRKRAQRRRLSPAVAPMRRVGFFRSIMTSAGRFFRRFALPAPIVDGLASITLFPQHPRPDVSMRAQREEIAQVWREVGGYMRTAINTLPSDIRNYEQKK